MNKLSRMVIASAMLAAVSAPASAQTYLDNWYFNPLGTGFGTALPVSEVLNFAGYSFIQDTFSNPTTFTFADNGVFRIDTTDQGAFVSGSSNEVTGLFQGATGSGSISGSSGTITFDSSNGATVLSLWAQSPSPNYGEGTRNDGVYYGTNDGIQIASFSLVSGNGNLFPTGLPNGQISITFQTNSQFVCGYFFDSNGVDLCTSPTGAWLSYTTTNASRTTSVPSNLPPELVCDLAGFHCSTGTPFDNFPGDGTNLYFVVLNGGQFRLAQATPEPGTIALLGLGLAGLGLGRRFRRA